ncbi:MAG: SH3 domain-containing protein [Rhodopseudomonas palustris]|uniref:SH3 domain-containing protein n=1 Tax=Rhodopseudomonas palustris TaxID=1076 RepID=A0A933RUU4_RHOPL|nr:SH3 domain-containing protein [Rhodopseudomonas palustris]
MANFTGPPPGAIRNKPISSELQKVLSIAAQSAGIDTVVITSGGQDTLGEGTRRTGSTRHDRGRAADLQLVVQGTALAFTDHAAPATVLAFITAAAAAGATGIGAGVDYMGARTIHVGFGTSINDHQTLTWGAGGKSINAPQWLRDAAEAGWRTPAALAETVPAEPAAPGRYAVVARSGLKLRGGPGPDFGSEKTLALGTELTVTQFEGPGGNWACVDVEGDGVLDGYVFAPFLAALASSHQPGDVA